MVSDTSVVFGPRTFDLAGAPAATFVERFTLSTTTGAYLLRVTNGPAGALRVTSGTVSLNGDQVVSSADLAALATGASRDHPVIVAAVDTIVASLQGTNGGAIGV